MTNTGTGLPEGTGPVLVFPMSATFSSLQSTLLSPVHAFLALLGFLLIWCFWLYLYRHVHQNSNFFLVFAIRANKNPLFTQLGSWEASQFLCFQTFLLFFSSLTFKQKLNCFYHLLWGESSCHMGQLQQVSILSCLTGQINILQVPHSFLKHCWPFWLQWLCKVWR